MIETVMIKNAGRIHIFVVLAIVSVLVLVVVIVVLATRGEHHPSGDIDLIEVADNGTIVASHNDCSDLTSVGYIKNNLCIGDLIVASGKPETDARFQANEVKLLDREHWGAFSAQNLAFPRSAVGRTDPGGHDCLVIGSPSSVPFFSERLFHESGVPDLRFWITLHRAVQHASQQAKAVLGMQLYPGPANLPSAAC